ncbi:MAG: ATP-binding protein [Phycisphaerales bacterium]
MTPPDDARKHRRRPPPSAAAAPSWASGDHPDAVDGPFVIERLTALTHDLGNLLDGSMRCLGLARRALTRRVGSIEGADADESLRQLDTVYGALERMADLVQAAMRGSASVVSSATLSPRRPISLHEAVLHAARVIAPEAVELRTKLDVTFADELEPLPAGALYTVILNGLRNALESIARVPEGMRRDGGRIEVRAWMRVSPAATPTPQRFVVIEVLDDGVGVRGVGGGAKAFEIGVSTKPGGLGVGLALAREVVRELAGTIELRPRPDIADAVRPGALLRITYPWPKPGRTGTIGGKGAAA